MKITHKDVAQARGILRSWIARAKARGDETKGLEFVLKIFDQLGGGVK